MVSVLLVALLSGVPGPGDDDRQVAPPLCAVAHAPAPRGAASAAALRRIFLRRQRFWDDGVEAWPVNLPASAPLRSAFSERVLGQALDELSSYWNDRYFHGTRPPPVLASEEAVLLFVARTPGAVGYVAAERPLPDGVERVACFEEP